MNQHQLNISIEETTEVLCEQCGNNTFQQAVFLRKAPRLLTGSPTDSYIPIPAFSCTSCGHVNKEFLPKIQPSLG